MVMEPHDAMIAARDPRAEAQRVLGDRYAARVLEPSPPASDDADFFADDPTDSGGAERPVVGPTAVAAVPWSDWLREVAGNADWASARWLGHYRTLVAPPETFVATRTALHRLAVYVISPARRRVNGKIALRWTLGGFGTPFFGTDEQVRVVADHVVRQRGAAATSVALTTLAAAADFALGTDPDLEWAASFDVPPPGDATAALEVDPVAAAWLGDWFGFAYSVLEDLRADRESLDASRVQLWPEHFDAAFECLPEASGRRAGYGASPGDAAHPDPYLYVAPWTFDRVPESAVWNADAFRGAVLPFDALGSTDQRGTALAWLRQCRDVLSR